MQTKTGYFEPIIGQECICHDGLGRVRDYSDKGTVRFIQVDTIYKNNSSKWAPESVELIDPRQKKETR